MKDVMTILALGLLISCSKGDTPGQTPTPVNNGPIGGTYNLTALTSVSKDTIPGSGIVTTTEYTTASTNLKGSIVVSATSMNSKGLMYDFTTTGVRKETNTNTGATTSANATPTTGSRGQTSSSVTSNYTINTTTGELTIDDAQYLFNPAFISQPSTKKHKYTLTGNVLKVITEYYDANAKYHVVNEASFTKQ
jgi:hypothetical protein